MIIIDVDKQDFENFKQIGNLIKSFDKENKKLGCHLFIEHRFIKERIFDDLYFTNGYSIIQDLIETINFFNKNGSFLSLFVYLNNFFNNFPHLEKREFINVVDCKDKDKFKKIDSLLKKGQGIHALKLFYDTDTYKNLKNKNILYKSRYIKKVNYNFLKDLENYNSLSKEILISFLENRKDFMEVIPVEFNFK